MTELGGWIKVDPDKTLTYIRNLVMMIQRPDLFRDVGNENLAERLAEYVDDLDGWLTSGGFLPASWSRSKRQ